MQSSVASSVEVTAVMAAAIGVRLGRREIASLFVLGAGLLLLAASAQSEQGTPLTQSDFILTIAGTLALATDTTIRR